MKLTLRQFEVLCHLKECAVMGSGYDGSVLRTLEGRGLVTRHFNSFPGYIAYTWTLTDSGRSLANGPAVRIA